MQMIVHFDVTSDIFKTCCFTLVVARFGPELLPGLSYHQVASIPISKLIMCSCKKSFASHVTVVWFVRF